jgi:hypothetical protein
MTTTRDSWPASVARALSGVPLAMTTTSCEGVSSSAARERRQGISRSSRSNTGMRIEAEGARGTRLPRRTSSAMRGEARALDPTLGHAHGGGGATSP